MTKPIERQTRSSGLARRELLRAAGLGVVGAGVGAGRLQANVGSTGQPAAARGDSKPRATSVVFIFQSGGPSQFETFDPKPDCPSEIRGEYGTIATRLAGIRFCEYLPRLAARLDRFSIVRTMYHPADRAFRNEHSSCHYLLHTGTTALPVGDTNATIAAPRVERIAWPSIGSIISYAAPTDEHVGWPAVIEIPRGNLMNYPGRDPGILGPRFGRWGVDLAAKCNAKDAGGSCPNCYSHDDPNDPSRAPGPGPNAWWDNTSCRQPDFHLPSLGELREFSMTRMAARADLLRQLDEVRVGQQSQITTPASRAWLAQREQALRLLASCQPGAGNPFDLTQESDAIRDLYGREEWGQAFLTARRLVEAGVRMVQVNLRGWDTHQNAFRDLKAKLLPSIDHCLSGFLDDLSQRGLLDSTLVVMCGEMGRTPKISPIAVGGKNASGEIFTPGRHHWGDVFPCFFAGGGIQPGRVIGTTDAQGGVPISDGHTPADFAATIFRLLGIDRDLEFHDEAGRPHPVYRGEPITALL